MVAGRCSSVRRLHRCAPTALFAQAAQAAPMQLLCPRIMRELALGLLQHSTRRLQILQCLNAAILGQHKLNATWLAG